MALVLASCIRDPNNGPDDGGGDKPFIIAFNPNTEGHGSTRAATYDGTWADFVEYFGGTTAQEQDIFTAPNPNPDAIPDGFGRKADRRISSFRVLVYHAGTPGPADTWETGDLVKKGNEYLNKYFEWTEDLADLANKPPFEIVVNKGTYDFVFIANENSRSSVLDVTVTAGVQSVDPKIATLKEFKKLTFLHDSDIDTDEDIPMTAWFPSVDVTIDGITYYENGNPVTVTTRDNVWEVKMTRAAIRLSFGIHLGKAQYAAWKAAHPEGPPALYIEKARNAGFIYPHPFDLDVTHTGDPSYDLAPQAVAASTEKSLTSVDVQPGKIMENQEDGSAFVFFDRIIVPEHLPKYKNEKTTALKAVMRFNYGSEIVSKEITVFDPTTTSWGYALPRNTWVWAKAEVRTDVNVELKAVPWGHVPYDGIPDQWDLHTDRSEFLFQSTPGRERIEIYTSESGGWNLSVDSDDTSWISIPSGEPTSGSMGANVVTTIAVTANSGSGPRTGHLILTAGKLTRHITVVQLPASGQIVDTPNPPAAMYVGAFWKDNQYGERLIRVKRPTNGNMDGTWAAYVIEGNDWIMLDTKGSADPNVGGATPKTNLSDSNFDANYRVTGYETSVSGIVGAGVGEGDIYFRIGLNGPYTPTAEQPVRYGLILLVYTSNGNPAYRRIWVRQGERADYLMRPDDANGTGGSTISPGQNGEARPLARRFSPYNLTALEFTGAGAAGAAGSATARLEIYSQSNKNNYAGAFTDYPTQAGGFFKWAHTEGVRAFNPTGTSNASSWGSTSNTVTDAWDNVSSLYENCPPGYRRPSDGTTGSVDQNTVDQVSVSESEIFQSLFSTAKSGGHTSGDKNGTDNSTWGLYADGWFDRTHTGTNNHAGANSMVAYAGRLFYNKDGYNSLFFPAAGNRHGGSTSYGALSGAGTTGIYWSSSASFVHNGIPPATEGGASWSLLMENNTATAAVRHAAGGRTNGFSIRCVQQSESTGQFAVSEIVDLDFAGVGHGETVGIVSIDENGFYLPWRVTGYEVSTDGTTWGPVTTTKPDWLDFPTEGEGGSVPVPVAAGGVPLASSSSTEDAALRAVFTPAGSPNAPLDLSYIYDGAQNTANSYIINGYGYYKLPLVYGNAIKNGAVNTKSFNPGITTGGALPSFLNHNNGAIASPYIYEMVTDVADATLVWMDASGLVSNVRLVDDNKYLAFDVYHESIVQGNAVVAVRDEAGDILWSWHIWVTPLVKNTKAGTEYDLTRNNTTYNYNYSYNFMKVNLGYATAATRSYGSRYVRLTIEQTGTGALPLQTTIRQDPGVNTSAQITTGQSNPYWQWGRKDPMPPGSGISTGSSAPFANRTLWFGRKDNTTSYAYDGLAGGTSSVTVGTSIKRPHTFIYRSSVQDWSNTTHPNRWDADNTTVTSSTVLADIDVVKTVYDPSPVGFKMPPASAWTGFVRSSTANGTFVSGQGWDFYLTEVGTGTHSMYPFTGYRPYGNGHTGAFSDVGYVWSALPNSTTTGYYLQSSNSSSVVPSATANISRATGASVRPVEDARPIIPGVRVPAGVIGYYAEDGPGGRQKGALTLEGDNSLGYGGGTSPVPVYAAYFKWGSLIAVNSEYRGEFVPEDIIAAKGYEGKTDPEEALAEIRSYVSSGTNAQNRWDFIPYGDLNGRTNTSGTPVWPETTPTNIIAGRGDPCIHYFGNGWRTPTNQQNIDFVGREGQSNSGTQYPANSGLIYYESTTNGNSAANPLVGNFPKGGASGSGVRLPGAGSRNWTGNGMPGLGSTGYYWSATPYSTVNGYELAFNDGYVNPSLTGNSYAYGFAVRCVPPTLSATVGNTTSWEADQSGSGVAKTITVTSNTSWTLDKTGAYPDDTYLVVMDVTNGTPGAQYIQNASPKHVFTGNATLLVYPGNTYAAIGTGVSADHSASVTVTAVDNNTLTATVGPFLQNPPPGADVTVGNVIWAGQNLAAPGVFAAKATDRGGYWSFGVETPYFTEAQFNSMTAGTNSSLGSSVPQFATGNWQLSADPCNDGDLAAEGWRLPTYQEIKDLFNGAVEVKTNITIDGMKGWLWGGYEGNGRLFLPIAGRIIGLNDGGWYGPVPDDLGYWTSERDQDHTFKAPYIIVMNGGYGKFTMGTSGNFRSALPIRCVKDKN